MKRNDNFMNKILIALGVFLLIFTITMIVTFWFKFSVPDTLITAVFGICASECGIMGWIRNTKQKYRDDAPFEGEEIVEEE